MVDYSAVLVSISNILVIIALFYFGYIMLKKMFKRIIRESIEEAIRTIDEKLKILNMMRNIRHD